MASTIIKPIIKVDEEILLFPQTEEQRSTIVHCRIFSPFPTLARIWSTTYLLEETGNRVPLIKAFKISMAPKWTLLIPEEGFLSFTLLFQGLSKSCTLFHLVENIAEPGGFFSEEIKRNETDVYVVELSY